MPDRPSSFCLSQPQPHLLRPAGQVPGVRVQRPLQRHTNLPTCPSPGCTLLLPRFRHTACAQTQPEPCYLTDPPDALANACERFCVASVSSKETRAAAPAATCRPGVCCARAAPTPATRPPRPLLALAQRTAHQGSAAPCLQRATETKQQHLFSRPTPGLCMCHSRMIHPGPAQKTVHPSSAALVQGQALT